MAMRRRSSPRRSFAKHNKDLLWVPNSIAVTVTEAAQADIVLLTPGDWQVGLTQSFERCTLLRIVGWLATVQTAAGTDASISALYAAVWKGGSLDVFDPILIGDYDDHDILMTMGRGLSSSATASVTSHGLSGPIPIDIRTKRRVDSSEEVILSLHINNDTATPAVNVTGILRCLVNRI